MKEWFRKQGYKFQQFMVGRYGIDQLMNALVIFYFIIILIANILYRFSKNIEERRAENAKWLKFWHKITGFFKFQNQKFKQRKTHKFVKCKNCKKVLRLPKHKGKISVTCPYCNNQFVINTGKKK